MKDNGSSKQEIYEKYINEEKNEKVIARLVAILPDKILCEKYKKLNFLTIFIVLLCSIPFSYAVVFFDSQEYVQGAIKYFSIVAIGLGFPILSSISFYLHRSQGYFNFSIMSLFFLIMSIVVINKEHYDVSLVYILGFIYCLFSIGLTVFTRTKLFPDLNFFGNVKRDENKKPIFK